MRIVVKLFIAAWLTTQRLAPRPTIAITKAHMMLAEMEMSVKAGRMTVDGHIVVNDHGELAVGKAAIEPVWYLPGVAQRFNIEEGTLRRALL